MTSSMIHGNPNALQVQAPFQEPAYVSADCLVLE